jgi:hypothetical protein
MKMICIANRGAVRSRERFSRTPGTRNPQLATIDGKTKSIREWCRLRGLNISTVRSRLRNGWSPKDAVNTPTMPRGNQSNIQFLTINGKTRPIREWARLRGIHVETIRGRLRLGWSQEDAVSPVRSGMLTLEGKTMSVSDWAKELGIPAGRIYRRLRAGMSDSEALLVERKRRSDARLLKSDGKTMSAREWARELRLPVGKILTRLRGGATDSEALSLARLKRSRG